MKKRHLFAALLAAAAVALGFWQLWGPTRGLDIARTSLPTTLPTTGGPTPVTVYSLPSGRPAPVVVIAHGFAGSQQLMQPFAVTLARSGYVAVTFDFLGHGRNPAPLTGNILHESGATAALLAELGQVVTFARTLPQGDGRLALLGHSMASDIIVRQAVADPSIAATVAVSMFSREVTATLPRNLLVIVGALEPGLKEEALRAAGLGLGHPAEEAVTTGSFADGTARRVIFADGVEHIGVLYSRESQAEALAWLGHVFGRTGSGHLDVRGPWLALLFGGLTLLAWPLSRLLPRAAETPHGAGLGWRRLWLPAVLPAVLTPLILWPLPSDFLPVLVGDYLALHFGLYGLLTGLCLWAIRRRGEAAAISPLRIGALVLATLLVLAYCLGAYGFAIDSFLLSFRPGAGRVVVLLVLTAGTALYFVADGTLTRGPGAARGGAAATKLLFLLSLAGAVALNPMKLFFLIIIVPMILLFFLVFGLISGWTYARVNHPLPAALSNAVFFAWAIAVAFPLVAG